MSKRKETQEYILKYIDKTFKSKNNYNLYKELFDNMSDEEFHDFMVKLRDNKITLSCIINTNDNEEVNIDNNIKVAKELGFNFFQKIRMGNTQNLPSYTTPNEHLVLKLPIRRAAQLLVKKISIPSDDKVVDNLTGQVTNSSKGSKLSLPEIQVLAAMGLYDSIKELVKIRGGDEGAYNALKYNLENGMPITQKETDKQSTGTKSTQTLNSYLNGMHIKSNIITKK